jgi:hypothetical protein
MCFVRFLQFSSDVGQSVPNGQRSEGNGRGLVK